MKERKVLNDFLLFCLFIFHFKKGVKSLKSADVKVSRTRKIQGKVSKKIAKIAITRGANENV